MITESINKKLNEQLAAEQYSANLYLSMSAYFDDIGLDGFASWMRIQYQEETDHALKFYDFIQSRGGKAKLSAIEEPPSEWANPIAAFEAVARHEAKVTAQINEIVYLAKSEHDYATEIFLQWFVTEQIEEEESAKNIIDRLKLVNGEGQGLLTLDAEAGARNYTSSDSSKND